MAQSVAVPEHEAVAGASLVADNVTVRFGGITALNEATLTALPGEITGLIGPNGAGKTTMFNCLTGIYAYDEGSVLLNGEEIRGKLPHQIADLGVSRTFQNLALFPNLTVRDNVAVGLHRTRHAGWISNAFRTPNVLKEEARVRAECDEALTDVGLQHLADRRCAGLPYGILKRIELARAIVSDPSLLLLDEPAAGLTHGEVDDLMAVIRSVRDKRGFSVILVEHHMGLVMNLCDHITVLNFGETIAAGSPSDIANNPSVVEAYLGASDDEPV